MADVMAFFDTCVRIGRSRAPEQAGFAPGVADLGAMMKRFNVCGAAVEHAVAFESSPRWGHDMLDRQIAGRPELRPAWHLMPDVSERIEKAVTDPDKFIRRKVALGRIDAKDFCNGSGDHACFAPVLRACQAVKLPVCLDFRRQGDFLTFDFGICGRWPEIPFVIEGFGGYPLHKLVWCLREYRNMHLSTACAGPGGHQLVPLLIDMIGHDRIIFGSNWPNQSPGMAIGHVMLSGASDEAKRAIAGGNFRWLLEGIGK
ncbi:MAG: amidohydrolase family protein [Planctomycetes bacterium]|nr:amidohydrolase family protein [Planctomycetota bacterium]